MEDNNPIMANEPVAASTLTTSYSDVMMMIHSMHISPEDKEKVGRRLVVEVTSKNLNKAFLRLDHLSSLEEGWDGRGAHRILPQVIRNAKSVLAVSDDEDWKNWLIGPGVNGTIGLQSKTNQACISLGTTEFSYFAMLDGKRLGESHLDFTPAKFLTLMRSINR